MSNTVAAILGAIIGAIVTNLFANNLFSKQRFEQAADKFRRTVINGIFGLYFPHSCWTKGRVNKMFDSISDIEKAGMEFRYFVHDSNRFTADLFLYTSYCNGMIPNLEKVMEHVKDGMPFHDAIPPEDKDKFKELADNLLSYTKIEAADIYYNSIQKRAIQRLSWLFKKIRPNLS